MKKTIKPPKRRAPNLTPDLINEIVILIHQWRGRLTWSALIGAIEETKQFTYTRQALSKHSAISNAYDSCNNLPAEDLIKTKRRRTSVEVELILEELNRVKAEVVRLKSENALLIGQFVRWSYNASQRGLTEDYLNQSLPDFRQKRDLQMQRVK